MVAVNRKGRAKGRDGGMSVSHVYFVSVFDGVSV
jgi:hypothetical protein